jgi:hypothetical protein
MDELNPYRAGPSPRFNNEGIGYSVKKFLVMERQAGKRMRKSIFR